MKELCRIISNIFNPDDGLKLSKLLVDLASLGYRTEILHQEHEPGWNVVVYEKETPDE